MLHGIEKVLVCELGCGHQTWNCPVLSASELRNSCCSLPDTLAAGSPDGEGSGMPPSSVAQVESAAVTGRVVVLGKIGGNCLVGTCKQVREF